MQLLLRLIPLYGSKSDLHLGQANLFGDGRNTREINTIKAITIIIAKFNHRIDSG